MVDGDAALGHHLLEIPEAQAIRQIPPHAEQDHRAIEVTAFEHDATPELARGIGRTELLKGLRRNRRPPSRNRRIWPLRAYHSKKRTQVTSRVESRFDTTSNAAPTARPDISGSWSGG